MVKKPLLSRFHYEKPTIMQFIRLNTICGKCLVASSNVSGDKAHNLSIRRNHQPIRDDGAAAHAFCPDYQATLKPAAAPMPPAESHEVFRRRLLFFPVLKVTPVASAT